MHAVMPSCSPLSSHARSACRQTALAAAEGRVHAGPMSGIAFGNVLLRITTSYPAVVEARRLLCR